MAAEIVGIEKINKYIDRYYFKRIKLTKGNDAPYTYTAKEGETQADVVDDFNEWVAEFIDDNNFKDYKLELYGTNNAESKNLSLIVKVVVAFHHREATTTFSGYQKRENNTNHMDVERYIAVATENATLKAQLERMEEKMDELLNDDDDDEVGEIVQPTFTEAINTTLIGKLDTIVDVVLGMLAKSNAPAQSYAINGIDETDVLLVEFRKVHPEIDEDIKRFYQLATTQPKIFKMVITQLRDMI